MNVYVSMRQYYRRSCVVSVNETVIGNIVVIYGLVLCCPCDFVLRRHVCLYPGLCKTYYPDHGSGPSCCVYLSWATTTLTFSSCDCRSHGYLFGGRRSRCFCGLRVEVVGIVGTMCLLCLSLGRRAVVVLRVVRPCLPVGAGVPAGVRAGVRAFPCVDCESQVLLVLLAGFAGSVH